MIAAKNFFRFLLFTLLLLGVAPNLQAQSASEDEDNAKGIVLVESVRGSVNTFGTVTRVDTTGGYNFNRYFGVFGGVPVYFVRTSSSISPTGLKSTNGVGDVYVGLALTVRNPAVNFASTLTASAPTGDSDSGLSTGRATLDWTNHFDRSFRRFTPFANVGLANSISDTNFFTRPFTSLGFISHWDGGATYRLWRYVSVGSSAYAIVPHGDQKVFSRLQHRATVLPGVPRHGRVFETSGLTSGGPEISRDAGLSAWVTLTPASFLDFDVGYTRSVHYALNTFSFGARLNLGSLIKKSRNP